MTYTRKDYEANEPRELGHPDLGGSLITLMGFGLPFFFYRAFAGHPILMIVGGFVSGFITALGLSIISRTKQIKEKGT